MSKSRQNKDRSPAIMPAIQPGSAMAPILFQSALAAHRSGRIDLAVDGYKQVLAIDRRHADAANLLGTIYRAAGQLAEAEILFRNAIAFREEADFVCNLGNLLATTGRLPEAEAAYRRALSLKPEHPMTLNNLGNLLVDTFRLGEAEAVYRRALVLSPNSASCHNNLGTLLEKTERLEEAEAEFVRSIQLDPNDAESHYNLGIVFRAQNRSDEAVNCFREALRIAPGFADAHNNLGTAHIDQGRFEEAETELKRVIQLTPNDAKAHFKLGLVLRPQGRLDEAEACYRRALQITPDWPDAHCNPGNVIVDQGRYAEAEACYNRALELTPNLLTARSNLLFALNYSNHSTLYCLEEARRYGKVAAEWVRSRFANWRCPRSPDRLRIGLVSGDFREHAVSHFLQGVVGALDPARIELFAYSNHPAEDEITLGIKARCKAWRPTIRLTNEAVARQIHADGVHILVDLAGHSGYNRLPVFAWKPAPIQISWLGYFATTGLAEMDYLIADPVTLPEALEAHFTEEIWRLPETRLCFTAPELDLPVSPSPALTNAYVTFGCFNNLTKMNDAVVALWARVLDAVPQSRLFLKAKQLNESSTAQGVIERFVAHGVGADRLILEGLSPRAEYLATYHRLDIALDPFPFTGGTTTAEALWMGVPVLTLAGDRFVSRQGMGLLANAGCAEWIAANENDYVSRAVRHAGDIEHLAALRQRLRQQVLASPLFDTPRFARHLETALSDMWQRWLAQQEAAENPAALRTPPDMIEIVSATRHSENDFWKKTALGKSLARLKTDHRLVARVAFENRRGLPEIYNERIQASEGCELLVFVHDDVWIDDYFIADRVREGLTAYDVIGVAGNRRRVPGQAGWGFLDDRLNPDGIANLSGAVAHGEQPFGPISHFGPAPARCELLDGVFIAARKSALLASDVAFDKTFDFHFYDLDFCRSASQGGLRLGTWPISLTHQSHGAFHSERWKTMYGKYLGKWGN